MISNDQSRGAPFCVAFISMEQRAFLDLDVNLDDELADSCDTPFPLKFPVASSDSTEDNAALTETAAEYNDQDTLAQVESSDLDLFPYTHLGLLAGKLSSQPVNNQRLVGNLSEDELVNLPLRDLNKLVRHLPASEVEKIRKKRRNLKNRHYASTLRTKRRLQETDLKKAKNETTAELEDAKAELERVRRERDMYKMKYEQLEYLWKTCGPSAVRSQTINTHQSAVLH